MTAKDPQTLARNASTDDNSNPVERLRSESALRSVMESVMAHAPHYIHMLDTNLVTTFINRVGPGYTKSDVVGRPFGEILAPADSRRVLTLLRRVLKTGQPTQYEVRVEYGGVVGWYKTSAGPVWTDGKITGLVLETIDVTTEKEAHEELLREKKAVEAGRQRDQALLNSIGDGLVFIDEAGLIANINPSAATMLGYTKPEELIGAWFTAAVEAYDREERPINPLDRPVMRALGSGQPVSDQTLYARKDGSLFPVSLTVSPVVLGGRPIGAIEVFRDITQEQELDQAKEEFVSLASHQLRTPASGVKAFISMLLDGYAGELTDQQRGILEKAAQANERQLEVIGDMLDVARLSAGRIIPEMMTTDLCQLINEVVDEQRPTIDERHQRLQVVLPEGGIELVVDPKLTRMLIDNLVSNASKYTPVGGRIRVSARATKLTHSIKVSDTGVGITRQDMPKLFQRFSRIPNRLSADRGGTGLGLYLVQTVATLHGGRLKVDSRPGRGTTFEVIFPRAKLKPTKLKREGKKR
jgi:PAS domain S-box-containing protein